MTIGVRILSKFIEEIMKIQKANKLVSDWLDEKPANPLLVVLGPTASGKTTFAIDLAREFDGEIVNADSKQIFRELEIGSAKPIREELRKAKHHLISEFSPDEEISVAKYRKLAEEKIHDISKRGKLPVLSGSHSLLISAIVENYQFAQKSDVKLRAKLEKDYEKDPEKVWQQLKKLSPKLATKTPWQNKHHLLRTLERALVQHQFSLNDSGSSNSSKSQTHQSKIGAARGNEKPQKGERKFDCLLLGLNPPREKLYAQINKRVDIMMRAGLLDEVKKLAKKYERFSPALRGHGYRELLDHLAGEKNLEQAIEEIKQDTRNYAKRQMSWWRNCSFAKKIVWI
jgi:tRNA dimethylallyltransferase